MSFIYTWYGHGTHGLEIAGQKVLVDPYFTDDPAARVESKTDTKAHVLKPGETFGL